VYRWLWIVVLVFFYYKRKWNYFLICPQIAYLAKKRICADVANKPSVVSSVYFQQIKFAFNASTQGSYLLKVSLNYGLGVLQSDANTHVDVDLLKGELGKLVPKKLKSWQASSLELRLGTQTEDAPPYATTFCAPILAVSTFGLFYFCFSA